jgi:transposase
MHVAREVTRILAYRHPVDMRNSFDGLVALVKTAMNEDPLSGSLYVFINRRRTHMKAVYWDRTGYCLFAKRLESARFVLPGSEERSELTERTFSLFLDGIVLAFDRACCRKGA